MSGFLKYNMGQIYNLVKALDDKHKVQVGIFGGKSNRKKPEQGTNAYIGAIHEGLKNAKQGAQMELGSITGELAPRSWLRMPLSHEADRIIKEASQGMQKLIAEGKMVLVLKRLGIACENAIQRAFSSGGFGMWPPDKPATIRRKHSSAVLIDTGQLRRSVASRVVEA